MKSSRRGFIKKAFSSAVATAAAPSILLGNDKRNVVELKAPSIPTKKYGVNNQVNVAVIGMGIMGFNNAETTVKVPGVKLVAACDLYTGRLDHAKEVYGKDILCRIR